MRKLTKKISMLMVLAMLVGLFSGVVSASAASAWSFKSSKYDVAVGGEINMKKNEYADFDLLKDGKAPEGYTVVWESSDEDVVWVNAKTGQLRADKAKKAEDGDKAVISATFTNTKTKKSATRSFTIVVGEVKAPVYTVEQADVTAVLGDAIKFAPVVKNEAGEVVKFATHKSYNGYFVDGKAITNPWTPEVAGEYTVTVAQFAKKADVADLAKAVRTIDVKVTVKADLAAEATGIKEITVYGDFAKDAKFTVKKNGTQTVGFTATVAEDGKSAVLALTSKIREGVYTVACGDAKVDLALEDERVDSIVIFENNSEIATDEDRVNAYVHYDVLNQYGDSVRKNFDITWTPSTGTVVDDSDKTNGVLVIPAPDGTKFIYGNTIILNGVYSSTTGNVKTVNATMTLGLANSVSTVNVLGVAKANNGTEILDRLPANFVAGDYVLVFSMNDRLGYPMEYSDELAEKLTFSSFSPLLVQAIEKEDIVEDGIAIDGVTYGAVKLKPGIQVKKGGVAELKITSTLTGKSSDYALKVSSGQILASFKILPPDGMIAENDGTIGLGYEAIDTEGEPVTDFRVLYKSVQFNSDKLKLKENNDGSASLSYTVDTAGNPSEYSDYIVTYTAIVLDTGSFSSVTFNIKEARYAEGVNKLNGGNILEGGKADIELVRQNWWANAIGYYDQYDSALGNEYGNYIPSGYYVAVKKVDGLKSVPCLDSWHNPAEAVSAASLSAGNADYDYFVPYGLTAKPDDDPEAKTGYSISIVAGTDVTNTQLNRVVEFALADKTGKIISGSEKKVTFTIIDLDHCVGFTLGSNDALIKNGKKDDAELSVTGVLANGSTVSIPNEIQIVSGGSLVPVTLVKYGSSINAAPANADAVTSTTLTVLGNKVTADLNGEHEQFKDLSVKNADGTNPSRNLNGTLKATVYAADGSGVVKDNLETGITITNADQNFVSFNFANDFSGYNPWINKYSEAYINANKGEIDYDLLVKYISKVIDNYGEENDAPGIVTITLTKLIESENGLRTENLKLVMNGQSSKALMISGAEIGDTFVATYKANYGANHTINFTVGADDDAYFVGSNFEDSGEWR